MQGLTGKAGLMWINPQRHIVAADVPGATVKRALFMLAVQCFAAAGYVTIGLGHFAKPDDRLVQVDAASITVTPVGRYFLPAIAMVFDRYAAADAAPAEGAQII